MKRRNFVKASMLGAGGLSAGFHLPNKTEDVVKETAETPGTPIPFHGLSHGWIKSQLNPELGKEVNGQSVVRYLRFRNEVEIDYLELKPIMYGRWVPDVPTHPGHLIISTFDSAARNWKVIKDVELPYSPIIAGDGLKQEFRIEEMNEYLKKGLDITHKIDLGGYKTSILKVECDREHKVWASHGENNGPLDVPFGILNSLLVFGKPSPIDNIIPPYFPPLTKEGINPTAPKGMEIEITPYSVHYKSPRFSAEFSMIRPLLLQLGWDGTRSGRIKENRLANIVHYPYGLFNGETGPMLRTFDADYSSNTWTGSVEISGNKVMYKRLHCIDGLYIDATFTLTENGFDLELTQQTDRNIPVIEAETWRWAWDGRRAITSAAAVPTSKTGRNGDIELPMFWAGDGNGCLRCEKISGEAYLQIESYRSVYAVTGGITAGSRPTADQAHVLTPGTRTSSWRFSVTSFEPETKKKEISPSIQQHWGSIYSCFRPEMGGFSNNALSVNCHVNQHAPTEMVFFTRKPESGPDPVMMYRFTVTRALMGGGGYGVYRNLYLDSDPILVSGVGRIHQSRPDKNWLKSIEPGLTSAVQRMLNSIGKEGLVVCKDLSGNSGSYRWSTNALDVIGFGHIDAYTNAWVYRAMKNAATLYREIGNTSLSKRCGEVAVKIKEAYATHLMNPETGMVAGWLSRDGKLHDYAFPWVNGVACAFGLLTDQQATTALKALENLRKESFANHSMFGLPLNLKPIPETDHLLPQLWGKLKFTSTFGQYSDGAFSNILTEFYIRALDIYGLKAESEKIVTDLEHGYSKGALNGGLDSGVEIYTWEGIPSGYEGTFVVTFAALYAIAVHRGLIEVPSPEWWV